MDPFLAGLVFEPYEGAVVGVLLRGVCKDFFIVESNFSQRFELEPEFRIVFLIFVFFIFQEQL